MPEFSNIRKSSFCLVIIDSLRVVGYFPSRITLLLLVSVNVSPLNSNMFPCPGGNVVVLPVSPSVLDINSHGPESASIFGLSFLQAVKKHVMQIRIISFFISVGLGFKISKYMSRLG